MKELRTLLSAKGFAISEDNTFTKLEALSGPDACVANLAAYINSCRNAKGFKDYKIIPAGKEFIVATDYTYEAEIEKLTEYANSRIRDDIHTNYAHIDFDPGSFAIIIADGKLVFKYVMVYNSIMRGLGAKSEHTDERPELERSIIEYATKILPKEICPRKS